MTHPLQSKDQQWRDRPNSAEPVFDPGAAPASADAEAGGARAAKAQAGAPRAPLPTRPDPEASGLVLPPAVWVAAALVVLAALGLAAWMTF